MHLIETLKNRAQKLKAQLVTLYYVYKNPKTKLLPKILIMVAIGYALSPIDLIPDFIPVLGYLDDLIILPLLISVSIKLVPASILEEAKENAKLEKTTLKKNWYAAVIIVLIWISLFIYIMTRFTK